MKTNTKNLVYYAMFTAISIILVYLIRIPLFPAAPYLLYDPADIPIFFVTAIFGLIPGLLITVAVSVIQWLTVSQDAGVIGAIMHIFATGSFVITIALIKRINNKPITLIIAFVAGIIVMTASMVFWNYLITPIYLNIPRSEVVKFLAPIIAPFNLLKGGINGVIALILISSLKPLFTKLK